MPVSEYADYLEFACAVAIAAGAKILPHFRRSIDIEDKGGKADYDPVTDLVHEARPLSPTVLARACTRLAAAIPGIAFAVEIEGGRRMLHEPA